MGRNKAREQQLRGEHPAEPWLWREEWVSLRSVYSNRGRSLGLFAFAIVWAGFGSAMAWLLIDTHTSPFRWLMLLFPILGIPLLYGGARLAILGARHPELVLLLDKVPVRPGSRFAARVEALSIPEGRIRTSLACIRWPAREEEETLWVDSHVIPRYEVRGTPLSIPIAFNLPFDARETSESDEIIWMLSVEIGAVEASPDLKGNFELPVFETRTT